MPAQVVNDILPLLNELFVRRTVDLTRSQHRVLIESLAKAPAEPVNERGVRVKLQIEDNQSFSSATTNEGDYAIPGRPTYGQYLIAYRYMTGSAAFNQGVFDNINSGDNTPKILEDAGTLTVSLVRSFMEKLDVYSAGNGSGTLTVVTNIASAPTYVCDPVWGTHRLRVGMLVQAIDTATDTPRNPVPVEVTAVSQSNDQFTTAAPIPGIVAGDPIVIFDTWNRVPFGLDYHVSASTAIWQNVNPVTEPKFRALVEDFGGGALSYARLMKASQLIVYTTPTDPGADYLRGYNWLMPPTQFAALQQLGIPMHRLNLDNNNGEVAPRNLGYGWTGYVVGTAPVRVSVHILKDRFYLVDFSEFGKVVMAGKDMPELVRFNGGANTIISMPRFDAASPGNSRMTRMNVMSIESAMNTVVYRRNVHVLCTNLLFNTPNLPVSAG